MSADRMLARYLEEVRQDARTHFDAKMRLVRELSQGVRPSLSSMVEDLSTAGECLGVPQTRDP